LNGRRYEQERRRHGVWRRVSRQFADGIVLHSTASHGGFHLAENANAIVHALYRNDTEFYEEDCEWAKVVHAFPHLFTTYERRLADRTLRDYFPDAYERVTGAILNGGQSHMRDRQEFESVHRNDWVVIAALNSINSLALSSASRRWAGSVARSANDGSWFYVPTTRSAGMASSSIH
jgi:hypothetical protein